MATFRVERWVRLCVAGSPGEDCSLTYGMLRAIRHCCSCMAVPGKVLMNSCLCRGIISVAWCGWSGWTSVESVGAPAARRAAYDGGSGG
jgi:hypothetical protein